MCTYRPLVREIPEVLFLRRHGVGVEPVDGLFDPRPEGQIREDLHDAATVGEGRLLQDAQILHQPVVDDVLHDLVHEIDLSAVQADVAQILRKRRLGGGHIQAHDLPHEFAQGLFAVFGLIFLLRADLAPEDRLQRPDVCLGQRDVAPELRDGRVVLMLADVELCLGLGVIRPVFVSSRISIKVREPA